MSLWKFDHEILDIIEKGLEGNGLTFDETVKLYELDENAKESSLLRWAGQELSMRSADGLAEVHAQIGLNSTTCPRNCKFCSFAACNSARAQSFELSRQDVVDYAKEYEEQGANLILLLTTASYKFDKLIEMAQAVREVISPEMPLLVNTDDLTLERCHALKAAGVNGCYHAVRMGEGVDTEIPVEKRLETFKHIHEAGLSLQTCVEPIGPEHSAEEIAEAVFRCIENKPISAGAARRVPVPGTLLGERPAHTELANGNFVAAYRLATGLNPRLNCSSNSPLTASSGANLAWSEVGSNPRDAVEKTEIGGHGSSIARMQKWLRGGGWEILDGPSQGWML
ncbi:MAG: radical SAM protein [Eggerthellaceae bacterium]|nr:radical SAM protein [Eggerthellaceae bacterium]